MEDRAVTADSLGILIKGTQTLLNQAMGRKLRPLGLTVTQFACLRALRTSPGLSGSDVARRMFVSRQSMNGVVTGLSAAGLVSRSASEGQHGDRPMVLTDIALKLLIEADAAVADTVSEMTEGLPDEDLKVHHRTDRRYRFRQDNCR